MTAVAPVEPTTDSTGSRVIVASPIEDRPTRSRRTVGGVKRSLLAAGPYLVATLSLLLGYLHYQSGTPYSLSPDHYRAWAFPAFRYSDVIWLYLRDGLDRHPIPYVDYPLEYPPLTGVASWLVSYAPDLPSSFALTYLLLAAATLATVWALSRLPRANPWYVAAAPALFFYTGHQWDPLAVGVTALSLVAVTRGRPRWGAFGLAIGVSLKLFPLAFLAALAADHLRHRRWRRLAETAAITGGVTLAANLPFALANPDGWSFFFRWNRDRLADSGLWVLFRGVPTETLTAASLLAAVVGGGAIAGFALWRGGSLVLPLGSTALLWWLLVNKTFTTHLVLWVLLAVAILRPPIWLWLAVVVVDLVGFQLGNYLNLYNVPTFRHAPLISKAVENIYDPLQLGRTAVLLGCVGWGLLVMWQRSGALTRNPLSLWRALTPNPLSLARERGLWRPSERHRSVGRWRSRTFGVSWPVLSATYPARNQLRWAALMLGSFLAATIVMTWPYALHLRDSTVVGFDPLLQIWLSQWVQHALATDPFGLWDANIFYPIANTLAYTDANIPGALLVWPLDLLLRDPILTNSLVTLATFVLAAGGMYALVHHLVGNRAAAWLAGLAYAFLPWRTVHLWHLNWLQSAWLPLIALSFLRLLERPTAPRAAVLALLVAIQTLTSFYFAVQIAILLGALFVAALAVNRGYRSLEVVKAVTLATAIAVAVVLPAALPYFAVREAQGLERTLAESEEYKATPGSFLHLPPWDTPNPVQRLFGITASDNRSLTTVGQAAHADGHQHPEIVVEDALYPGLFAIVGTLAALAWWRSARWPLIAFGGVALVSALLSLGPSLGPPDGSGVPLPYGWLFERAPFFTAMRVPARLGGLVAFALVACGGLGVAAAWTRWGRTLCRQLRPGLKRPATVGLTFGAGLLILGDLAALPVPLAAVELGSDRRAAYEWLADQPPGAVMEFPAESIFADPAAASVRRHVGLSLLASTIHWQRLVNGNSGFIPPAHSDLLEAFVGNIPRPDGSLALRISHVDRDQARLLQTLGVDYLLFHRDRYRAEDWPAVESALGEAEGIVELEAEFDDVVVYRVLEPLAATRPTVTLWAPTLLRPGDAWAPLLTVQSDAPAPLALTRPTRLDVTWFDADGRRLVHDERAWPLPAVVNEGTLLCTGRRCRGLADADLPHDLPDPATGMWRPSEPGHYVAAVELAGDIPLSCQVDLDVVEEDQPTVHPLAQFPRWAECVAAAPVPVNSPGSAALAPLPPSVTFAGGSVALQTGLAVREEEEVRAWFLLAPPGDPAPWRTAAYRSPVQQRIARPDEPATFSWLEQHLAVPPGVYGLTVWFHRATDGTWEHADGGRFGMAPVVVGEDGSIRWAGPIRIARPPLVAPLVAGRAARLPLAVSGESPDVRCHASWRLIEPASGAQVAAGHAGRCGTAAVTIPADITPGGYRLELVASAVGLDRDRLTDGIAIPVTVVDEPRSGTPR